MAYAERVRSPKGDYWRGRYQDPDGRYLTVRDAGGRVIRYPAKLDAEHGADDAESAVRGGDWIDPRAGLVTFGEWASAWYRKQDLAESTMENYRQHLVYHLLPYFQHKALADISEEMIGKWARSERARGYEPDSIRTWRATLHTCLEDATGTHISVNPATRKRGRGKRSGRAAGDSAEEKMITDPLGVLLIAERMAILSGRDDELVMVVTGFWDALRLGETVGLESRYVRPRTLRVDWQLHEIGGKDPGTGAPGGRLVRCPPKDGSRGTLDQPQFLARLLAEHIMRTRPEPCPCHGKTYVFRGMGIPRGPRGSMSMRELAALAGVSETVVATVLGKPGRVSEQTRRHVEAVIAACGYRREAGTDRPAWHWRRSAFEELFTAAASGWLPARAPLPRRPVPVAGDWPGMRVRGRNAQGRAQFCWLPVAEGLTPHGLRHSAKTWMEEEGIPEVLSEQRLRHEIAGISGRYRHVTQRMRDELVAAMTAAWEGALDARLAMSERSPAAVLDTLLRERLEARRPRAVPRNSPETSEAVLPFPRGTASDLGRGGRI